MLYNPHKTSLLNFMSWQAQPEITLKEPLEPP